MAKDDRGAGELRTLLRGFNVAAKGNASAFGFSILITVVYGTLSIHNKSPNRAELIGFAMSSVAAFSLLNVVAAAVTEPEAGSAEKSSGVLLSTALDFLAVGGGVGLSFAVELLVGGWPSWVVTPFAATLAFVALQAVEMMLGRIAEED